MPKKATKYIFVTGGVLSGLGKGITAASIGNVLKARGLSVNIQKCDPYLNVDAGTLNPAEHGEAFVTYDGAETDLDLGHYERFLNQQLDQRSSLMSGRVLQTVIQDERRGEYLGKTVQIIPHVTDAIQDEIALSGEGFDVHIVEIGGTVGDYESLSFIEAIREFCVRVGAENCLYVHVVYVPYLGASKEFKTKPSQNAVRSLRSLGVSPEVLVVRSEEEAPKHIIKKLSAFTGVAEEGIALLPNAETVYEVPLTLEDAGISTFIEQKLHLSARKPKLAPWRELVASATKQRQQSVKVGIIAKYMDNEDTYMSVFEALRAAGWEHQVNVDIEWINSEGLEGSTPSKLLSKLDGVLVPGGFGSRGVEGKIKAATYAMRTKTPYLGLCLGMQVGVIAFARQVLKGDVHTTEIQPDATHPVINLMEHQKTIVNKGGTMRLGDYECKLTKGSKTQALYQKELIAERHRHRYEFNNEYRQQLEAAGLTVSGQSPDGNLVEIVELRDHPFFIGSQFHPEFTSRPDHPHPLFSGFIAELKRKKYNTKEKKG